jgi:hypothetical protein
MIYCLLGVEGGGRRGGEERGRRERTLNASQDGNSGLVLASRNKEEERRGGRGEGELTLNGQSGRKFKIRFSISIPLLSEYHVPLLFNEVEYLKNEKLQRESTKAKNELKKKKKRK